MDDLTGSDLGRYHLIEIIGSGGMAQVYRAYQTDLRRFVAVKVLSSDDEVFKERFRREARVIASLNHDHVLPIYDYGEQGNLLFIVSRYIEGGTTLTDLLAHPMSPAVALRLISPVLDALGYAHSLGIIHRDIKPGNILMLNSNRPLLADFGIAKLLDDGHSANLLGSGQIRLTGPHQAIGTAAYMAPEQISGKNVDGRTDLYSLGVVLYEMLTGRLPFESDESFVVLLKHINETPPPARMYNPALSPKIETLLGRALAKDPSQRFQTAAEMLSAFAPLISEPYPWSELEVDPLAELYEPGLKAFQAGQYAKAIELLTQVVARDSGYKDAGELLRQARQALKPARGLTRLWPRILIGAILPVLAVTALGLPQNIIASAFCQITACVTSTAEPTLPPSPVAPVETSPATLAPPPATVSASPKPVSPPEPYQVVDCSVQPQNGQIITVTMHVVFAFGEPSRKLAAEDRLTASTAAFQKKCSEITTKGYGAQLIVWDDRAAQDESTRVAEAVLQYPWVAACVVGHSTSNTSLARSKLTGLKVNEMYSDKDIAMLPPSASASTLQDGVSNVTRVIGTDDGQGKAGAELAIKDGHIRVLIISPDVNTAPNASEAADNFRTTFKDKNAQGVASPDRINYTGAASREVIKAEIASKIKGEKPTLVYFTGPLTDLGELLVALKDSQLAQIPILGIDVLDNQTELINITDSHDWSSPITITTMSQPLDTERGKALIMDKVFSGQYSSYSAESYDAMMLCMKGTISKIGDLQQGEAVTSDAIRRSIRSIDIIQGSDRDFYAPPYRFIDGDSVQQLYFVRMFRDGKLTTQANAIDCTGNRGKDQTCRTDYPVNLDPPK